MPLDWSRLQKTDGANGGRRWKERNVSRSRKKQS